MQTTAVVVAVSVCYGLAIHARLSDGFANVDDYLYARQAVTFADGYTRGPAGVLSAWRAFGSQSPLFASLAAPLATVIADPAGLLVIQIPILAATVVGVFALSRQLDASPAIARGSAAVAGCMPAVSGYSVMVNFALLSSSLTVWSVYAYLRSNRLTHRLWSITCGGLIGLLALSRVVAVVYVMAVSLVILWDTRATLRLTAGAYINAAFAAAAAGVVALPWWVWCARPAGRYLLGAGYSSNSGFVDSHNPMLLAAGRFSSLADLTGVVLLICVGATAVAGIAGPRQRKVTIVAAVSALIFLGLATSDNAGTAFELPMVLLAVCLASVAAQRTRWGPRVVAGALAAAVAVQFLSTTPHGGWFVAYPGRQQLHAATGLREIPDTVWINRQVIRTVAEHRTMLLRDDAVVNDSSLRWNATERITLTSISFGDRCVRQTDLAGADLVLWGESLQPYHRNLDRRCVAAQLARANFVIVAEWRISIGNVVQVWARAEGPVA